MVAGATHQKIAGYMFKGKQLFSPETSKGDFAQYIALGLVLLLMAFVVNLALAFSRCRGRA